MANHKVTIQSFNTKDVPKGTGVLPTDDALRHIINWENSLERAAHHLDALLDSAKNTKASPKMMKMLTDEMRAHMEESIIGMEDDIKLLKLMKETAGAAFNDLLSEIRYDAILRWETREKKDAIDV